MADKKTETHQIQFNNYLVEFIQKLQIIAPSEKRTLSKYYKYYRGFVDQDKRVEFIAEFIQYISKYNKEISTYDESLFSEEEGYYPNKPIQLLKGIDFKKIWRQDDLTEPSKESIWKYLQTLYLIGTFVLKEVDRYNDLLKKQQAIIYNLLQSMKYEKQIKEDAEKLNQKEDSQKSDFDFSSLGDLFDENNIITQIAKEIAKELNISGGTTEDPMQIIRTLFGQDGSKMQEIIARVGTKLSSVLREKGLTETELLDQAKQMNEKLMNKFKGIPGMQNIEKLSQKFAESFAQSTQQPAEQPTTNPVDVTEQKEKCEKFVQELTNELKQNLSELGLDNVEEFQTNLQAMMTKMTDTQPDENTELLAKINEIPSTIQPKKTENEPTPDKNTDDDAELKEELVSLKKKFMKKK